MSSLQTMQQVSCGLRNRDRDYSEDFVNHPIILWGTSSFSIQIVHNPLNDNGHSNRDLVEVGTSRLSRVRLVKHKKMLYLPITVIRLSHTIQRLHAFQRIKRNSKRSSDRVKSHRIMLAVKYLSTYCD